MIRNYLKASVRNLLRDKSYSLINIFGLSVGIAACLLITLYITDELSYDKFHAQSERIHRMYIESKFGDKEMKSVYTANPAKEALLNEFSQIEEATHFFKRQQVQVNYQEQAYIEDRVLYADNDFFKVFTFPLIKGNPKNVLAEPDHVVLTNRTAKKYFGQEEPIGKMVKVQGDLFQVAGVCEDVPHNSHFHFDMLVSYSSTNTSKNQLWVNSSIFTYMVLKEGVDPDEFEKQLDLLVTKYVGPDVEKFMGIDIEEYIKRGNTYGFFLQSLQDIYLHSDFNDEIEPVSSMSRVWYFSVIALFILVIACINFMNLATAKYANRAKEVGIRKVVGSKRKQLVSQFLTESIMVSLFAVLIAVVLTEIFLPVFNHIAQKSLDIQYFTGWYVLPGLFGVGIFVGILAGIYPAFYLSSFNPIRILKGQLNKGVKGNRMRAVLVGGQFIITIILFVSTFVIYQQNDYMTNKKLGFDKEKVLVLNRAYYLGESLESFVQEVEKSTDIKKAALAKSIPGKDYDGSTYQVEGRSTEDVEFFAVNFVEENYINTMGIELLRGRFFSKDYSDNPGSIVINRKGAEALGFENPIGKYLKLGKYKYNIIGVVENHHFESLHRDIRPLAMRYYDKTNFFYMPIKLSTDNLSESIALIQDKWDQFTDGQPFSYFFLDSDFNKLYNAEQRTAKVFTIFSILAILIACLGLFGLSAFMAEKRTKEIGIRKALGAKPVSILLILYKEVLILLAISTLIAWPLTYYLMNQWLENFAYKIGLGVPPFIAASFIALLIAVLTTSFQALKAANTNPALTLRDE